METKIKKLEAALTIIEDCENKRAVQLVYMSIVFLGYKIPEVAAYFKIPELKVQSGLTKCHFKLKKSKKFMSKMHKAARIYNIDSNLKLIA